jgi:signal transduction histidine kinase/CheY-like chemotaxis protein
VSEFRPGRLLLAASAVGVTIALWAALIPAPDRGPYKIGCTECPGNARAASNPLAAFSNEVLAEAGRRRKIELIWTRIDVSVEQALVSGKIDLWPRHVPDGPVPAGLHYSAAWLETNYALLQRDGRPPVTASGRGKRPRIGHIKAPFLRRILDQNVPGSVPVEAANRRDLVLGVCEERFDASLLEARAAQVFLMRLGAECPQIGFQLVPLPGAAPPASIAARRGASRVADSLREEIVRMASDGALARLHAKWFFIPSNETQAIADLQTARSRAWQWGGLALGATLLGVLSLFQTRRLRIAQQQAAAANASKSRFLASMSHEIRTPMNAVLGLSNMLLETRLDSRQRETARLIRHSAESLLHIINDVLDVSKMEAGKLVLDPVVFPVASLIEDTASLLRPRAAEKNLKLTIRLDESLPAYVRADKGRVAQVLLNLMANAVKFTEKGEVEVSASVPSPGQLRISVRDTGIGIPADALPRLFAEFEQVDPSITTRFGGTGLGLAISRKLVKLMGGDIAVASDLGKGSTFTLTLPVEPADEPEPSQAASTRMASLRILLCEDNAVNQRIAVHSLRRLGHVVEVAANGQEALEAAGREDFDIILMDCHMPVLDGYEATRRLKGSTSRNRETPVIALTAAVFQEDRDRCIEAGMADLLGKPIQVEALAAALVRHAPGRSAVETL